MFRTVNDQPTLWDAILPAEVLVLPASWRGWTRCWTTRCSSRRSRRIFDPGIGRPSIPMETYLRLMFLKFRYRLGYESLCREVTDSISWQRFCRIPFGTRVPHPTTLMKITTRCGDAAVAGLNEALLAKAATAKLLRTEPGPRRHHGRRGRCGLSDRFGAAGQGGRTDGPHGGADQGRRRRDPAHAVAGPSPRGGPAGPRDRRRS